MIIRSLIRFSLLALVASTAYAAPANPEGDYYNQPDGTSTPQLFLKGNEHNNWMADSKGYTVLQDPNGWWVYANKEDGELTSSGLRVGHANPKKAGLSKNLQTDPHKRPLNMLLKDKEQQDHRELLVVPETALCSFQGTKTQPCRLRALVILVRFTDHQAGKRLLPSPEEYDILFNHNGPTTNATAPTGSVADVFMENSFDSFVLESHISPWLDVNRTEAQTVDDNQGLNRPGTKETWRQSMVLLESSRYFGNLTMFDQDKNKVFDCLVVLHSGCAAETGGTDCETLKTYTQRIWSHATSSAWFTSTLGIRVGRFYVASGVWGTCPPGGARTKFAIARIAVIAHECSHFLGLPDLYDSTVGAGLGNFELQANMWGWYGTQYYPPLMSAWSKSMLHWAKVQTVTQSGTYTLGQACTSDTILKIDYNMPAGEYFLLENRYPCGFDSELRNPNNVEQSRNGVAIWHIDETELLGKDASGLPVIDYQTEGRPGDGVYPRRHYEIALVQADGMWDLEKNLNKGDYKDLFRRSSGSGSTLTAYRIGPEGITLNSGVVITQPNTNSYAYGVEKPTGITIEVGALGSSMTVTVTLAGTTPVASTSAPVPATPAPVPLTPAPVPLTPPPTRPPTFQPTPPPTVPPVTPPTFPPTPPPTLPPTTPPTLPPTTPPTLPPTPEPTLPPTPEPTLPPTPEPTLPPTPSPTLPPTLPPTPSPTTLQPVAQPTYPPTPQPTLGTATPVASIEVFTCNNDRMATVEYTGVGKYPTMINVKTCKFINTDEPRFCMLDDLSRPGKKIYQTCQNQCDTVTKCPPAA